MALADSVSGPRNVAYSKLYGSEPASPERQRSRKQYLHRLKTRHISKVMMGVSQEGYMRLNQYRLMEEIGQVKRGKAEMN